jgi:hypothetical protein
MSMNLFLAIWHHSNSSKSFWLLSPGHSRSEPASSSDWIDVHGIWLVGSWNEDAGSRLLLFVFDLHSTYYAKQSAFRSLWLCSRGKSLNSCVSQFLELLVKWVNMGTKLKDAFSQVPWYTSVVPATWEVVVGEGLIEPRSSKLAWAT